jgi:hypothetical protein
VWCNEREVVTVGGLPKSPFAESAGNVLEMSASRLRPKFPVVQQQKENKYGKATKK